MIQPGKYRARATIAQLSKTKNGSPQMYVEFELSEHAGQHVPWYGYFTEKTIDRTMESLRACGWSNDDVSNPVGITSNEVSLTIETEEYNGEPVARVRWVNPLGSGIKNAMTPEEARAFAATVRAAAIKSRSGQPAAPIVPRRVSTALPSQPDDDSVPF